jgi:hypothetical protein
MQQFNKWRWELSFLVLFAITLIFAQEGKSKFSYGFSERLRNTTLKNLFNYNNDIDDDQNFFRIRTSIWGGYEVDQHLSFFAKITNENRPYLDDYKVPKTEWNMHEIFFDNLYLKASFGDSLPLTVTVGRQDMIFGEGFVILEGAPYDGSRSIYHDAIRISQQHGKTKYDIFVINNTKTERHLPLVSFVENDVKQNMNVTDEIAAGIYVTNKSLFKDKQVEGYYIYKQEKFEPDELNVNTIGARLSGKLNDKLSFAAEGAEQFGSMGDLNLWGIGGYAHASYKLTPKYSTILKGGIIYLSGDDPNTITYNEGWNPVFSRWPKWSELYIYSLAVETGQVAYWTNMLSPFLELNLTPFKPVNLLLTYYHMRALQERTFANGEQSGLLKGSEIQLLLKAKLSPCLTGHFLYDIFMPGDFYASTSQDAGQFIRFELFYLFKK